MPALTYFSIGKPKQMNYGTEKVMETAICKEAVEEAYLSKDGFHGDGVADLKHHGGLDRAVCVYPYEHYAQWQQEFGTALPPSAFGENVTVANLLEADVAIGDIYQLGDAVIQVTQGRIPCNTINRRVGQAQMMKRMVETGFTGYLCRVLEEGVVRSDSNMTLLKKDPANITVLFGNETYFHHAKDAARMRKMIAVEALADDWRERLDTRLAKVEG
ncbi:MOSC domain-containing protein [Kurthia huakuii]|uniref:MOSC domain-containing protein n=1 Tax=Kurthia huakuii TaxID=1421019 RepID=UPI0004964B30|nr:MOSC domain-containing protein [Kurthia huakuii]MBM7700464.1 MOSC domain-containing protein YiiM [Kurthia huakuii]